MPNLTHARTAERSICLYPPMHAGYGTLSEQTHLVGSARTININSQY